MLVNTDQVLNYFNDPDNVHKLYVYEIVNFDNNIESVVSENTNNFLKIKHFKTCLGIFESAKFAPQLKILSQSQQDIGIRINTDYIFLTNDNMGFLEKTKKTFVFTVQEPFNKESIVYFLGDGSLKCINDLNSDDTELKLDDDNLINLYSIALQAINKLEIGRNSNINFLLIDNLPKIKKINSVTYDIPLESIYQTIQVVGTIKNDLLGIEIADEKLDLEIDNNIGVVPIICNLKNLNQKSEIDIFNFDIQNQIPLVLLKDVLISNNVDIRQIFSSIDQNQNNNVQKILVLLRKIILISYIYNNNFCMFNKQDTNFVNYYNATYANRTALDINTQLIFDFQIKNQNIINTFEFKIFKAICFSLSHFLQCPYSYKNGLCNEHKNKLWFWLDIFIGNLDADQLGFKYDGSFKDDQYLPNIFVSVNSDFFDFKKTDNKTSYFLKSKTKNICSVNQKYLPKLNFSSLDDNNDELNYLSYLFILNDQLANELISNFSVSNIKKEIQKEVILKNDNRYPTLDELKAILPVDAFDVKLIGNIECSSVEDAERKLYLDCPLKHPGSFAGQTVSENKLLETLPTECKYLVRFRGQSNHGHGGGSGGKEKILYLDRPYTHPSVYQSKALFEYSTYFTILESKSSFSTTKIFNFLLDKNNNKTKNQIKLVLNKDMQKQGWYISNIKEDYHYSFFNSSIKMSLNYDSEQQQNQIYEFEIKNSFQKIDNTNVLTKNRY